MSKAALSFVAGVLVLFWFLVGFTVRGYVDRPPLHPALAQPGHPIPLSSPLTFSGEPSRGAYAPVLTFSSGKSTCLVMVANDDHSKWHYEVWREGEDGKRMKGSGSVVLLPE